jgi:dihydrofolate reductase
MNSGRSRSLSRRRQVRALHGISFFRALARLDLIDEYRVTLVPYLAGEGPRLFQDAGKAGQLELLSSVAFSSGLQLDYRLRR